MKRYPFVLLVVVTVALLLSGVAPYDRTTWWLEIFPILILAPILVATYRRFPLSTLLYTLLAMHAFILMLGGHYTYAQVPLGFWAEQLFGFTRNHYDRVGHFAQGFVPAILAREILLRTSPLRPGRWLFVLVTAVCLAFSACYEFIEWWAALAGGASADAFLGTQGDVWDTQWDMFFALIGAITAQLTLSGVHDRALAPLPVEPSVDHIEITVRDMASAVPFYDRLLPLLGFDLATRSDVLIEQHEKRVVSYEHPRLGFAITSPRRSFAAETVNRRKPGALHHLAFRSRSRAEVDRLHVDVRAIGATIVSPPREYPEYTPSGYYAFYFKDPEGIKYEIVSSGNRGPG